jgi:hypothetical protein
MCIQCQLYKEFIPKTPYAHEDGHINQDKEKLSLINLGTSVHDAIPSERKRAFKYIAYPLRTQEIVLFCTKLL